MKPQTKCEFLPISRTEMETRGWEQPDFVLVTGDAYVDHPSFGTSIISRVLEACGLRVCILSQPDWRTHTDFQQFGRPRLGFFVNSGNVDSMVAHYTAARRKRSDDAFTPGGKAGRRPDRAVTVYCRKLRECYPDVPLIIGGLEASLRRFAHYDYWADRVFPSILVDSGADLLIYGMGENQTIAIAKRLAAGESVSDLTDIRGTCYLGEVGEKGHMLPSFEKTAKDPMAYADACREEYDQQDAVYGKRLLQPHGSQILVQNPPMPPLTTQELDWVYSLPYARYYHPSYEAEGGVPAIKEVQFSITHNRGCFGACNFCSIAFHQGRAVTVRSEESVLKEAELLTQDPMFKGYIHDVGGPTANFRRPSCEKQAAYGLCKGKKCLAPIPCKQLQVNHEEYLGLLRKIRSIPKIKKVFIRSGIRYDYLMEDRDDTFFKELVQHHISGQLKVAPEHCSAAVLDQMGKPHVESYLRFARKFRRITKEAGKEQYLVPYLMSSHPGSTLKDAVELALFLKREGIRPQQVQDFYPTPGTISTCEFYTGINPYTKKPVFVPRSPEEKAMQRALLQYFLPKNRDLVLKALVKAGRTDCIGRGKDCLTPPPPGWKTPTPANAKRGQKQTHRRKGGGEWHGPQKRY